MKLFRFLRALRLAPRNISRLDNLLSEQGQSLERVAVEMEQLREHHARQAESLPGFFQRLEDHERSLSSLEDRLVALRRTLDDATERHEQAIASVRGLPEELNEFARTLSERIDASQKELVDLRDVVEGDRGTLPPWWEPHCHIDPSLRTILSVLCGSGHTVFDVGANVGAISVFLSRIVGPSGKVCSFEASPRVLHTLSRNLLRGYCTNAYLIHAAVYARSNEEVELFYNQMAASDSLITRNENCHSSVSVPTVAIDDFVQETGLVPDFIKMDIEGAEPMALEGMKAILPRHKPHLILETFPESSTIRTLIEYGYRAFECNTLEEIGPADVWHEGTKDLLYVHADRIGETLLGRKHSFASIERLAGSSFDLSQEDRCATSKPVPVRAGICKLSLLGSPTEPAEAAVFGIRVNEREVGHLNASWDVLHLNWPDMLFHVERPGTASVVLRSSNGGPLRASAIPDMELHELRFDDPAGTADAEVPE